MNQFEKTINDITKKVPTPFYLYDKKGILENLENINEAFSWNEGFREHFAVKATPNPAILSLLKSKGCGVDCASMAELVMAERCGFRADEIMFTSNDTPIEEYKKALELGAVINIDDVSHLDMLLGLGLTKKMCARFNPGEDFIVENAIMGSTHESKFGMRRDQILDSFKIMKENGVEEFGIHCMLGSCSLDERYYPALLKLVLDLMRQIKKELDIEVSFVDLAGGIGIPYKPDEKGVDIKKIGLAVKNVYDEFLASGGWEFKILTELGRFVTGPFGYLVTTCIHKKQSHKNYIGVDACAVNLMRPAMYGAYHKIINISKSCENETEVCDVVGSLCENNDKFAIDRTLPKTDVGDILLICDAGAHGYSMGYNYNGKLKCAEVLLDSDNTFKLIRRRETIEDYFATLDVLDF